jgi:hypothetical protein
MWTSPFIGCQKKKGRAKKNKIVLRHQLSLRQTILVYQFVQNVATVKRHPEPLRQLGRGTVFLAIDVQNSTVCLQLGITPST